MTIVLVLFAYLDPGSGSYLFQLLIAGVTGIVFLLHRVKHRIRSFFGRAEPDDSKQQSGKRNTPVAPPSPPRSEVDQNRTQEK
jgi:hypothetical protein